MIVGTGAQGSGWRFRLGDWIGGRGTLQNLGWFMGDNEFHPGKMNFSLCLRVPGWQLSALKSLSKARIDHVNFQEKGI
jgi:hypothetical protein